MTEEVQDLPQDNEDDKQQKPALTPIEERALEMGWRPKEEFEGEEEDFIDAKEFVNRKPLFDRIEHQSKQIKNVTRALEALKTHYTTVEVASYNRALTALKQERKQAMTDGDGDKFEEIDAQIKTVETQAAELQASAKIPVVENNEPAPEFQSWLNKNPWYNNTKYMKEFADEVGNRHAAEGMSPTAVLVAVEKAVRKEFPHKFTNPNKETAPVVGNNKGRPVASANDTMVLSEQERRIMDTLVRQGVLTKEKYIADLKAAKQK